MRPQVYTDNSFGGTGVYIVVSGPWTGHIMLLLGLKLSKSAQNDKI